MDGQTPPTRGLRDALSQRSDCLKAPKDGGKRQDQKLITFMFDAKKLSLVSVDLGLSGGRHRLLVDPKGWFRGPPRLLSGAPGRREKTGREVWSLRGSTNRRSLHGRDSTDGPGRVGMRSGNGPPLTVTPPPVQSVVVVLSTHKRDQGVATETENSRVGSRVCWGDRSKGQEQGTSIVLFPTSPLREILQAWGRLWSCRV